MKLACIAEFDEYFDLEDADTFVKADKCRNCGDNLPEDHVIGVQHGRYPSWQDYALFCCEACMIDAGYHNIYKESSEYDDLEDADKFEELELWYGVCAKCDRDITDRDLSVQCRWDEESWSPGGCGALIHFSCVIPTRNDLQTYETEKEATLSTGWTFRRTREGDLASDRAFDNWMCPDCNPTITIDESSEYDDLEDADEFADRYRIVQPYFLLSSDEFDEAGRLLNPRQRGRFTDFDDAVWAAKQMSSPDEPVLIMHGFHNIVWDSRALNEENEYDDLEDADHFGSFASISLPLTRDYRKSRRSDAPRLIAYYDEFDGSFHHFELYISDEEEYTSEMPEQFYQAIDEYAETLKDGYVGNYQRLIDNHEWELKWDNFDKRGLEANVHSYPDRFEELPARRKGDIPGHGPTRAIDAIHHFKKRINHIEQETDGQRIFNLIKQDIISDEFGFGSEDMP